MAQIGHSGSRLRSGLQVMPAGKSQRRPANQRTRAGRCARGPLLSVFVRLLAHACAAFFAHLRRFLGMAVALCRVVWLFGSCFHGVSARKARRVVTAGVWRGFVGAVTWRTVPPLRTSPSSSGSRSRSRGHNRIRPISGGR